MESIAIIGTGRLGSALAKALYCRKYSVHAVIDQDLPRAESIAKLIKPELCSDELALPRGIDIVFLCVPDDEIAPVANKLAHDIDAASLPHYAFHCSGATSSDALMPLQQLGVSCASVHPIQSFSGKTDDWQRLSNIFFGLEGNIEAVQKAAEIIKSFNSAWFLVPKEKKCHYHIACTMASNYLAALLVPVVGLLTPLGLPESQILKMLHPLMETTLSNLTSHGIEGALTGPISRGDISTIHNHLKILTTEFPHYALFYKLHGQILLNLRSVRETIPADKYHTLRKLLNDQGLEYE